jgi:hypothetical protein
MSHQSGITGNLFFLYKLFPLVYLSLFFFPFWTFCDLHPFAVAQELRDKFGKANQSSTLRYIVCKIDEGKMMKGLYLQC